MNTLVKERAIVTSVDETFVWVEAIAVSGCNSCEVKSSCGTGLLSQLFSRKPFYSKVNNSLQAKKGEEVIVGIPQSGLILASLALYGIPLMIMIVSSLASQQIVENEGVSIISGLIGLCFGFYVAKYVSRRLEINNVTQLKLIAKASSNIQLNVR